MATIENLPNVRHSLAHLLAMAVLKRDPQAKLAIGPVIDDGFYYDFEFSSKGAVSDTDFKDLEKSMRHLISQGLKFDVREVSADEAREFFAGQPYKLELINELEAKGEKITLYKTGEFTDLCRGGHVESTKEIDERSFKLSRMAGAYWRGDEKNPMLSRIYGLAFATREEMDAHLVALEEAKKRDHKVLGRELDLFFIDEEVGKGLPMWTPKGTTIKFELENFTRDLERKYGYEHVATPYLGSEKLYATSGHLSHYKENMYAPIDMDGDIFYLRPMACPHHIRMYMRKPVSYRHMPVRYAEIADYNRYEKSGELMGMIRVRKFQLTDAHIFVTPDGLKEEFKNVCRLIEEGLAGLGFTEKVRYRFSKHDPADTDKYFPDPKLWSESERTMKEVLDEIGFNYFEAEGEAAFYGPKLDVQYKNVNGKEDTIFTAQIDFLLPEKFGIEYTDSDGTKKRPVMIHRSAIGALERTFAFLIELYAGAFPLWLAPIQVKVIPIADTHKEYAKKVFDELFNAGFRVELDDSAESLGKKIRTGKLEKLPYMLVIGDKEVEGSLVTVESRDVGNKGQLSVSDLISKLNQEIAEKSIKSIL